MTEVGPSFVVVLVLDTIPIQLDHPNQPNQPNQLNQLNQLNELNKLLPL